MMVCFDWFFPESARTLALRGAQIIAHPANLVLPYCQTAMVTRCLETRYSQSPPIAAAPRRSPVRA
jgi:predicted amidohydrolase